MAFNSTIDYRSLPYYKNMYLAKPPGGRLENGGRPWTPGVNLKCTDGHQFLWTPEEKLAIEYMSMRKSGCINPSFLGTTSHDAVISDLQNKRIGGIVSPLNLLSFTVSLEFKKILQFNPRHLRTNQSSSLKSMQLSSSGKQELLNEEKSFKKIQKQVHSLVELFFGGLSLIYSYQKNGEESSLDILPAIFEKTATKLNCLIISYSSIENYLNRDRNIESIKKIIAYCETMTYALQNRETTFVKLITPNKKGASSAIQKKWRTEFGNFILDAFKFNLQVSSEIIQDHLLELRKMNPFNFDLIHLEKKLPVSEKNQLQKHLDDAKKTSQIELRKILKEISVLSTTVASIYSPAILEKIKTLQDDKIHLSLIGIYKVFIQEIEKAQHLIKLAHLKYIEGVNKSMHLIQNAHQKTLATSSLSANDKRSLENYLSAAGFNLDGGVKFYSLFDPLIRIPFHFLINFVKPASVKKLTTIGRLEKVEGIFPILKTPPFPSSWISPVDHLINQQMEFIECLEHSPCLGKMQKPILLEVSSLVLEMIGGLDSRVNDSLGNQLQDCLLRMGISKEGVEKSDYFQALRQVSNLNKFQAGSKEVNRLKTQKFWHFFEETQLDHAEQRSITSLTEKEKEYIYQNFKRMHLLLTAQEEDLCTLIKNMVDLRQYVCDNHSLLSEIPINLFENLIDNISVELETYHLSIKKMVSSAGNEQKFTDHAQLIQDLQMWQTFFDEQQSATTSFFAPENTFSSNGSLKTLENMIIPLLIDEERLEEERPEVAKNLQIRWEDFDTCILNAVVRPQKIFPLFESPVKRLLAHQKLIVPQKSVRETGVFELRQAPVVESSIGDQPAEFIQEPDEVSVQIEKVETKEEAPSASSTSSLDLFHLLDKIHTNHSLFYCQDYLKRSVYNIKSHLDILNELMHLPSFTSTSAQQVVNKACLILETSLKMILAYPSSKKEVSEHPLWLLNKDKKRLVNSHDLCQLLQEASLVLKQHRPNFISKEESQLCKDLNHAVPRYSRYPSYHSLNPVSNSLLTIFRREQGCQIADNCYLGAEKKCYNWAKMALEMSSKLLSTLVKNSAKPQALFLMPQEDGGAYRFSLEVKAPNQLKLEALKQEVPGKLKVVDSLSRGLKNDEMKSSPAQSANLNYRMIQFSLPKLIELLANPREEQKKCTHTYVNTLLLQASLTVEQLLLATIHLLAITDPSSKPILENMTVKFGGHSRLFKNSHHLANFLTLAIDHIPEDKKAPLRGYQETVKLLEVFLAHLNHYPSNCPENPLAKSIAHIRTWKTLQQLIAKNAGFFTDAERLFIKPLLGNEEEKWKTLSEERGTQEIERTLNTVILPLAHQALELSNELLDCHIEWLR